MKKRIINLIKKVILYRRFFNFYGSLGIPALVKKTARNDLDGKLSLYLNYKNGFYVEAGANNGLRESNTYYLEKALGWRGVLVEAIPELYQECKKNRPKATVINGGLVSNDFEGSTLKMHYANLMSVAEGAMKVDDSSEHIRKGLEWQRIESSYSIDVQATTFEKALGGYNGKIDFLSIDLEGYEIEALNGWNFSRHRPRYVLIEARDPENVEKLFKSKGYVLIDQLTYHDYLYRDGMASF